MPVQLFTAAMLCLLLLLGVGCDWLSPEAKIAKHRERAAAYFEKGQYQEALIEYQNVAQSDAKDADAQYHLALTHLKLGGVSNLQAAFAYLRRSVELDKNNRDAQLKLGELYLLGNEPAKARTQAEVILVAAPQDPEGLVLHGRSLINEQRYQEGIAELKKAIELDPKNMPTYVDLARAYMFSKDQASAEAALRQGLAIDPRSIEILAALGDFYLTTGKPDQAEALYKQALDAAPERDEPYLKLSGFYQRQGKWTEVEATLQKLAALKPHDEKPHIYLGDFFAWLGQPDKALANYQKATEVNPNSASARDKLIAYHLDLGNIAQAQPKVKAILEKNNKDLIGRFFDARLRLLEQKPDEAIPLLQGVIRDEPQFAGAHHFLGIAFLQKRQTAQARGAFLDAVKLNPNLAESRVALGQVYLAEGSADLAIEQAQAAVQLNPRNVQALIIAGDAYLLKGDTAKSKQVFEAVAQALPKEPIGPYRLGLIANAEKNDGKALSYFEEALSRKPTAIEPITQIAILKMSHGKAKEARDRVIKQLDASPNNPQLYNLLGSLWMKANEADEAETAFKKAIDLDNSLLAAYMNLAALYHQAGKVDQAAKEYTTVLTKDPTVLPAHMLLGIIYDLRKDSDKARMEYEQVLKLNPKFAPAANNLAWLMAEQGGNLDVALSYAQTAREQQPNEPHIADTLGWIYYKKNAYLLAVNLLKESAEKLTQEPVVQYHYGMALYKNGNATEAKKALQASLKLNANFAGSDEARKTLSSL